MISNNVILNIQVNKLRQRTVISIIQGRVITTSQYPALEWAAVLPQAKIIPSGCY